MKPSAFTYHRPGTVSEALAALAEVSPDGKILAGGQSLVPMLNMRLTAPAHLVDINGLAELGYVGVERDGTQQLVVRVGATARHTDVERDDTARAVLPLLHQALEHVAHPAVRNRGTTVGSIAHADPAGEMTAVLALLAGTVTLRSAGGSRGVSATDFFVGPMQTCAQPGELVTSVDFPVPEGCTGSAWREVARRHGDYAVSGVGALVTLDEDRRVVRAQAAYVSAGPTPVVLDLTDAVAGAAFDSADWPAAGRHASDRLEPEEDIHATAAYRRHLAGVLTARALREAAGSASHSSYAGNVHQLETHPPINPSRKVQKSPAGGGFSSGIGGAERPHEVSLVVNGLPRSAAVPARRLLSDFLRHDLGLTGTHVGCEHGVCGACTVVVDGRAVRSCLQFAVTLDGAEVTTVEGCTRGDGELGPVQRAFRDCHGLQCGFCTPGFVTTITAYLDENPAPTEDAAREAIAGNLCRCTGYQNIVASVLRAAHLRHDSAAAVRQ